MTEQQFKDLLVRLYPENKLMFRHNLSGLVQISWYTAGWCFVHQIENKDSQELKKHLLFLVAHGRFNFDV